MYGIIVEMLQPFGWMMWGLLLSLAWLWRKRPDLRRTLKLPTVLFFLIFLDTLPLTAWISSSIFECRFDRVANRPEGTSAIVVLGGNAIPPSATGEPTRPGYGSLLRAIRAAELYREGTPCPVIVSGGKPEPSEEGDSPGQTMVEVLKRAGVAESDIHLEGDSRDTAQNAEFTARILHERGWTDRVVLVTSAAHLWRSQRLFEKERISVIPAGCDYYVDQVDSGLFLFWPKASAIAANQSSFHEALGFVVYWVRGEL